MRKRNSEKDPFRKALLDMKKEGLYYPSEFDLLIMDQDFENPGFKKSFNINFKKWSYDCKRLWKFSGSYSR